MSQDSDLLPRQTRHTLGTYSRTHDSVTKMTTRTDREIWAEVLAGSSPAWTALVRRYEKLVYTVASRAGLSYADVGDCFQTTWLQLYQARKRIQEPDRLSAWLVTTAKREALKLRRKAQRFSPIEDSPDPIDSGELPDEELERVQLQHELETGLGQLDKRCNQLLQALFFAPEKRTYEEIAKSLGVSSNTLGPARKRCLERLKKILEQAGFAAARNAE